MKLTFLSLAAVSAFLTSTLTHAANPDMCTWYGDSSNSDRKFFSMTAPSQLMLNRVAVGEVMAAGESVLLHNEMFLGGKCKSKPYIGKYYIANRELADGFTDVYKTDLTGVGVRVRARVAGQFNNLPFEKSFTGAFASMIALVKLEFVRTGRFVGQGTASMNFSIQQEVNGWNASQVDINGSTTLTNRSYFSGCAGVEQLNIHLGKIPSIDLGKQQTPFNLEVLCEGMMAGSQVPVRVYFEGSSDGPGRLNLDAGGAKGVEIVLKSRETPLPFSASKALSMSWIRTQDNRELYSIPLSAGYARKGAERFNAGKANASLNYIIEYD
ncbi:fimbrial protein [Pseudomonas sp. B15(2017)]|uniref:fimbrial protein n=1 Tax=Pseudomonas sp. B15(2017) TaxID=1981744 RepID=UPI000A1E5B20|nr:fimbrial protein [Pseudomonas sp. B15(2017)]